MKEEKLQFLGFDCFQNPKICFVREPSIQLIKSIAQMSRNIRSCAEYNVLDEMCCSCITPVFFERSNPTDQKWNGKKAGCYGFIIRSMSQLPNRFNSGLSKCSLHDIPFTHCQQQTKLETTDFSLLLAHSQRDLHTSFL